MDIYINIFTSMIASSIVVFILKSYLSEKTKASISYEYATKLDSHKNELQSNTSKELEKLKSDLKIYELKQNIKMSSIHIKQAECIEKLHVHLWDLFDSINDYTTVFQARTNSEMVGKRVIVQEKLKIFSDYLRSRSLFLDKPLYSEMEHMKNQITDIAFEFMGKVEKPDFVEKDDAKWTEIHTQVNQAIKSNIENLENQFRQILGATT